MIFSIRNLGFELGSLLLEGWAAFAARVVCAALLLVLGWLARQLLSRKVCPALLRRSWRLAGTPILLRSFAVPVQRLTLAAFIYAAAASLPWAIAGVSKFLLTVFELAATFFVCQGLYAAADLTDLLLANCGEEVRANRTLTTLLNKVYKVLIVVLGVMTMDRPAGGQHRSQCGSCRSDYLSGGAGQRQKPVQRAGHPTGPALFHRRLDHRGRRFRRGCGHQLPLHQSPRTG